MRNKLRVDVVTLNTALDSLPSGDFLGDGCANLFADTAAEVRTGRAKKVELKGLVAASHIAGKLDTRRVVVARSACSVPCQHQGQWQDATRLLEEGAACLKMAGRFHSVSSWCVILKPQPYEDPLVIGTGTKGVPLHSTCLRYLFWESEVRVVRGGEVGRPEKVAMTI